MFARLKSLLLGGPPQNGPRASVPSGARVYAIGDVHGRADLLRPLIAAIDADDAARGPASTTCIMLGDLVDRGPDSAGVVTLVREWQQQRSVRVLGGNHEEMFLKSFDSVDILRHFLRHGGRETLLSYGVNRDDYARATVEEVQQMMHAAVPQAERDYIAGFESTIVIGDYLFVHAGIAPGVALDQQREVDLRWIREPFLSHAEPHEKVVVHGHSITEQPDDMGNRIGIDTGAYASGRLTALALEGSTRRYLTAVEGEGGVTIEQHPS